MTTRATNAISTRGKEPGGLTEADRTLLRRLRWLAVLAPISFLGTVEVVRLWLGLTVRASVETYLGLFLVVAAAAAAFTWTIFSIVDRLQARLSLRNRELLALDAAALAIVGNLDLETVLQEAVDQARDLVGARYGALQYRENRVDQTAFITSGITQEERIALGPAPEGHGLLGVVLSQGEHLRLRDLSTDSRSIGFPPNHPPMRSLLAVPIVAAEGILGNLYVSEKTDGEPFTVEDELTLERFATHAALAIANAMFHREKRALATTEERERIAREMHDSTAQVLGFVSTKAQAVEALIARGESEKAIAQNRQLIDAARAAYADVREAIGGLRATPSPGRGVIPTLRDYLITWQGQHEIEASLEVLGAPGERLPLSPTVEVQLLRIVQEALTNVRKHAGASTVTVTFDLASEDHVVRLRVCDDGNGFDPEESRRPSRPRFGLSTMRERAESIGATFVLTSSPGAGTDIAVDVPTDFIPPGYGVPRTLVRQEVTNADHDR